MKIPKQFYVKGKLWRLEYRWGLREAGESVDGLCDIVERAIYIRRELSKDEKAVIFLHELVHAILFEAHLSEDGGVSGFPEEVICASVADVFSEMFDMRPKKRRQ